MAFFALVRMRCGFGMPVALMTVARAAPVFGEWRGRWRRPTQREQRRKVNVQALRGALRRQHQGLQQQAAQHQRSQFAQGAGHDKRLAWAKGHRAQGQGPVDSEQRTADSGG